MSLSPNLIAENPNAAAAAAGLVTTIIAAAVMGIEVLDPTAWVKPLAAGALGVVVTRGAIHLDTGRSVVTVGKAAVHVEARGRLLHVTADIALDDADAMLALAALGLAPASSVVPAPAPQAQPCPLPPHKPKAAAA